MTNVMKINKQLFNADYNLNIIDKMLNGEPMGTKVELSIQI